MGLSRAPQTQKEEGKAWAGSKEWDLGWALKGHVGDWWLCQAGEQFYFIDDESKVQYSMPGSESNS